MDEPIIDRWMTLTDLETKRISFAQNGEDILLERAFPGEDGFYIDVGANDPVFHSVTKRFSDRGWRGVNIEPNPALWARLRDDRPRDVNLNLGEAAAEGTLTFFEVPEYHGWSTFEPLMAQSYQQKGVEVVERSLPVTTLALLCEVHVPPGQAIDFLKIDVEGLEPAVIAGADWQRWRPRVVVVEATWPEGWEGQLLAQNYLFAAFDAVNRFYVRGEEPELLKAFEAPLNVMDNYVSHELVRLFDGLEGVGPNALGIARRLHRLSRRYPRLASTFWRVFRSAG